MTHHLFTLNKNNIKIEIYLKNKNMIKAVFSDKFEVLNLKIKSWGNVKTFIFGYFYLYQKIFIIKLWLIFILKTLKAFSSNIIFQIFYLEK